MSNWDQLASDESINRTIEALKANGINAEVLENGQKAKERVLQLIPQNAEVFNATSVTLETIGLPAELNESGKFNAVRPKLMSQSTDPDEKRKLGAAPEYVVGSVHAVTEDGKVLIASNTGSQLPAYAYGASHVIWVVGAQKLVKNFDEGVKRIYEYVLPLESERAKKAYGVPGSAVNKMLVVNKEVSPNRITLLIVKQKLGF